MHVYLREEPVEMEIREVEADGLVPEDSELIPVAFYVAGNERPSFRAILPPATVAILEEAILEPVHLGLLAEEPEGPDEEIRAMVGLSVTLHGTPEAEDEQADEEEGAGATEPWSSNPEAWKGDHGEEEPEGGERTVLLAFAPLVRLHRKFPGDFGEELADLLESALAGDTRPSLEARVDRMLGDL
ncbi:MAG TPA: hypothetical protein VHG28_12920 [Longimicrobiaceae bacterium]|nr:hypothetical protein [Longimicrobiaceae bacterium]